MISFIYDNNEISLEKEMFVGDFIKKEGLQEKVLACKKKNTLLPYDYVIKNGDVLSSVTIADGEGYMIYKETLILVLLYAAEQLLGDRGMFVRQSVNKSTYFEMDGVIEDREALAEKIKAQMEFIIKKETPMFRQELSKEDAYRLFIEEGEEKRAEDIMQLPAKTLRVCRTAKKYHVTYQQLAYSVKAVNKFELHTYNDGFLLKYPTNYTVDTIPEIKSGQKIHRAIEDYRDWISTVGAEDVFSLNRIIREGKATELINLSEGLHEKRISRIADTIKANPEIRIILIAGPSSSGKTTFANRLCLHLKINHINPMVISLDDYYVEDERMPLDENGEKDLESVEAIDYELFNTHLELLAKGESVEMPKYDFNLKKPVKGKTLKLSGEQILIVEGIHALNELLTSRVEKKNKYKIYLSALTSLCLDEYNAFSPTDNRLIRRMVRDAKYRNTSAEGTFKLWKGVRKGEQKYIFPFESEADEVFNSTLVYELAVLKRPALELLEEIREESEHYSRAKRLTELLSYFEALGKDDIPPTSILREFVGGSTIVH